VNVRLVVAAVAEYGKAASAAAVLEGQEVITNWQNQQQVIS
jgi:hypothetical protein